MVFKFLLSMVLVFALAVQAQAESISVVTEEWPPYNYSEDGEIGGVMTEVVRATLDRAGVEYSINMYPWARAYDEAKSRKNVLIYSICRLPSREGAFKWIKIDGLSVDMHLFRPKDRPEIEAGTIEKAKEYRVGATRDSSTHHFLLEHGFIEGANLYPVKCEELNTLKSRKGVQHIDLTTGDRLSLAHWLKISGYPSDYWVEQAFLFKKDVYMAFGTDTPDETVEKVRAAFEAIKEEGVLEAILERYRRKYQ